MNDNQIENKMLNYVSTGLIANYEIVKDRNNECDVELILNSDITVKVNNLSNSRLPVIAYLIEKYIDMIPDLYKVTEEVMDVDSIILETDSTVLISGFQYDGTIITFSVYLVDHTISDMRIYYETRKSPKLNIDQYSWGIYDKISMIPSKNNTQVISYRKANANIVPFTKNNLEDRVNTLKREAHKLMEDYIKGLQLFIKA